jgi:predicted AlkP superfamily pyrophosphatase or phosphodiesterase
LPRRVLWVAVAALAFAALAAYVVLPERGTGTEAEPQSQEAMADALGTPIMEHIYRGHVPERSAEIFTVPTPYSFMVTQWPVDTLGTDSPYLVTAHPNPWDYITRVPLVFYGPKYVAQGMQVDAPTDIASMAPTYADILGVDLGDVDGEPLDEVVSRSPGRKPKAIVTVVIDGGGWNVLQEHPDAWPTLDSLMDGGTSYVNATIGSAPSITGALHATFGTGDYPIHHGVPGNQMRAPNGENVDTWLQNADPRYLESPTVSELWDESQNNKPVVGTVSYEGWHLGMIGHGAQREGGDKDVAVLWEMASEENAEEGGEWWVNEDYYELPDYLLPTDIDRLETYEEQLDPRDGIVDDAWFGHTLEELQVPEVRPATPAFVEFTGDAVIDVMRNEKVGRDAITDMFWVEMKMPDFAGHRWNMEQPEEEDVLRETDDQIGRIKAELDKSVGKGNYILAVSADHGQQPLPDLHGGWRISSNELELDIETEFGGDILEKISPVDIYVNMDRVEKEGIELEEITEFLSTYTIGDNLPQGIPGADRVPEGRLDERLFVGAFTTDYLQSLTPEAIESFGESEFDEGVLVEDGEG